MNKIKVWFKNYLAGIYGVARFKRLFFAGAIFMINYGAVMAVISMVKLSFYIGITASYSLILGVCKYFALRRLRYMQMQTDADKIARAEYGGARTIAICTTVMTFLFFAFTVVSMFFYDESTTVYGMWLIIFIAAAAFIKIILTAIESIRTRKNHNIVLFHVKLADVANAFIALALLQRAILYHVGEPHAKWASAIGGVFFSLCAALICLFMYFRLKNYFTRILR